MKTREDDLDLAAELRSLRPRPSDEFAAELDRRASAGFADAPSGRRPRLGGLLERLRALPPRRVALPAAAAAATALVVATVVVSNTVTDPAQDGLRPSDRDERAAPAGEKAGAGAASEGGVEYQSAAPAAGTEFSAPSPSNLGAGTGRRAVERDAQIVLGAEAGEVGDDAAKVFDAVQAVDGVVLRSSIQDGAEGEAGAEFELLVPAGKLGDALAAFSRIGDVRSRRESTLDITAPTVGVRELLRDSRARIDGLLGQLASAESDEERGAVETELRRERRRLATLRSRLDRLDRRANFARVSLLIESTRDSGVGGHWGIGDALDDAGRILATGAGVTVIALAVLTPFALLALLAWLSGRTWLRRRREQALG